jgi:hypothetical protein
MDVVRGAAGDQTQLDGAVFLAHADQTQFETVLGPQLGKMLDGSRKHSQ